jgi:Transglycosylase SLT domain
MLFQEKVSSEFADKVKAICSDLEINPDWLMYVMNSESAGTFSPSVKNPHGSATGLIQFTQATANGLGYTMSELSSMSAVEQLDVVKKYLSPYADNINSVSDLYLSIFYPAALKYDNTYRFPDNVYKANSLFDIDKLGYLTKQDFIDYVNYHYSKVGGTDADLAQIDLEQGVSTDDTIVIIAAVVLLALLAALLFVYLKKKNK